MLNQTRKTFCRKMESLENDKNISLITPDNCKECDRMCLNRLTMISGLDEGRQRQIMDSAIRHKYRKGSYLFREGDPCDGLFLLKTGKVKLCTYDSDGREEISASLHLRPETVSRKLKELQKDNIITKTGQSSIKILDFQALRDEFKY